MLALKVRTVAFFLCLLFSLAAIADESQGQSLDARAPSPVRRNEIVGRISARDLGDARLTDHFYTFAGTPGDLLITIQTQNLNGDVDVFTAGSLRPVLKFAVYAESTSPVTKNIYLRQREELILRIEARTPNDDDGIYRIRFSGTFEPMSGVAEEGEETVSLPTARKGKRVSSVGARIEDPVPPPVDVPSSAASERTETATEDPAPMELKKEPVVEAPVRSARNNRVRSTPTPRRTTTKPASTQEAETSETTQPNTSAEATTKSEAAVTTAETPPKAPARRGTKKSSAASSQTASNTETESPASPVRGRNPRRNVPGVPSEAPVATSTEETKTIDPAAALEELRNAKIIIELLDGTRFERAMIDVQRVNVENGYVVVIGRDGKVDRVRLSRVVRMTIGP